MWLSETGQLVPGVLSLYLLSHSTQSIINPYMPVFLLLLFLLVSIGYSYFLDRTFLLLGVPYFSYFMGISVTQEVLAITHTHTHTHVYIYIYIYE